MNFEFVFVAYLIATTINSLVMRQYASQMTLNPLLSAIPTNLTVSLPLALIFALLMGDLMIPSVGILMFAVVEAAIGTIYSSLSLVAQKHSDASTFATLIKLHVVIVVLLSSLLLGESLSSLQILGSSLLLFSGFLISRGVHRRGLVLIAASIILLALMVVIGRIVVIGSSVGTSLVLAISISLSMRVILQGKNIASSCAQLKREYSQRAIMSITQFAQIALFVLAVDLSGNVSLVSSLASFKVITVMIAAYFFLNEHSNPVLKILAAVLSLIGVVLIL